jgi:anti-sigma B factor antagonist
MLAKHLETSVRLKPGGAVLALHGEINGFAQEALNAAYTEAEAKNPETILLNFEEVHYIDSAGLVLIGRLLAKARASKRRLLAYGLSDHYVEIFDITRLSDFVSVLPDEESALSEASVS